MKMEHRITCVEDEGTVSEVRVAQGEQVAAGDVLVVVAPLANPGAEASAAQGE